MVNNKVQKGFREIKVKGHCTLAKLSLTFINVKGMKIGRRKVRERQPT